MIHITNNTDCCGCAACEQICPKNCISYELKDKGIYEPVIDQTVCIECGLCEKVCPGKNRNDGISTPYSENDAFLAYSDMIAMRILDAAESFAYLLHMSFCCFCTRISVDALGYHLPYLAHELLFLIFFLFLST